MSTTFLFLDQQLGNDHQVVGQHGRAHQQLEPLAPLRQATFHAPTTEEGASVIDCWWLVLNPLLQRHLLSILS